MLRSLFLGVSLLISAHCLSACDSSSPNSAPEVRPQVTYTELSEKDGGDAPWVIQHELFSEYDDTGRRIRGEMLMYDDDGSLRQILVDSVFYQEDGSFLRTEFWVQDFARGQESLQPNGVTYVDRIAADGSEVTITESPDGEPVSRATRWYDNEPSEMSRLVRERWANGSWTQESRTLILERDPAGKVLLRRTEEWVDGAWRLNLFYDQVERDPSGRVVSAYEKGERPVTFTYAESGLLVEKTEGRLGEPQSRWRYEHADVQGR